MAKRPVPLYDFVAFGRAIKEARTSLILSHFLMVS